MSDRPEPVRRIVKPRRAGNAGFPIITANSRAVLIERTGEVHPIAELPAIITSERSSIVAAQTIGYHIERLNEAFKDNPRWQFRATPTYTRGILSNGQQTRAALKETVFAYFGFEPTQYEDESGNTRKRRDSHYHYPLDPLAFVRKPIHELDPSDRDDLIKLLEWAQKVRAWCNEHELAIRPTAGGISGQLLRDARFYPEARRKVPGLINRRARDVLPGNFYRLYAKPGRFYRATYLDMQSAHHTVASEIQFPDANSLHARGRWQSLEDRPWAVPGTPLYDRIRCQRGLFYVRLASPHFAAGAFPLPYMESQGSRLTWLYSNEWDEVERLGGRVEYIIAAWSSPDVETGLNTYARWSLAQVKEHEDKREWLKPTLLSAYGILAARPKPVEFGFHHARNSEPSHYPVGSGMMPVQVKRTKGKMEMKTVNVIHRGMIEAETRLRCLRFARALHGAGLHILAIYADSVFVESGPLPLIPSPWSVKGHLTGLRFLNATQFTSRELTKLPGIAKEDRERLARRVTGKPRKLQV